MNVEILTEDGELVCTICYEKIGSLNDDGNREQPVQLDCQHVFGNICLDTWLARKSKCPICRTKVDGYDSSDSGDNSEITQSDSDNSDNEDSDDGSDSDGEDDTEGSENEADENFDVEMSSDDGGEPSVRQLSDGPATPASDITHITISSDNHEGSDMSLDEQDGQDSENEQDDVDGDADVSDEDDVHVVDEPVRRRTAFTPHELMTRFTQYATVNSLMNGLVAGRFAFGDVFGQPGVPLNNSMTDESD
jgi:hypothetical protein